MDTVILAAGKNGRLKGIAAPYMKPLLVVNGQALIAQAVRHAAAIGSKHVVIVAAPQNVHVITELLEGAGLLAGVRIVVQARPRGPGEALYLGARLAESDDLIVLMGDNVLRREDVVEVAETLTARPGNVVIGIRTLESAHDARRFTLVTEDLQTVEGVDDPEPYRWRDGEFRAWLGPLGLSRDAVLETIRGHVEFRPSGDEIKIGPSLRQMNDITLVRVDAQDIGVPEALL